MTVTAMNHFTILTDNLDATIEFYRDYLGLETGERPPLKFPGAWLYAGKVAVLHIIAGKTLPEPREGVIDHIAFSATGLRATVKKLIQGNIDYSLRQVRPVDPWQLFFFDPSGAKVELDYPPNEPTPEP
ncbi:MAG: VOC family protein [Burkholderiales bacterium]|jgi:catechol 2,3-dioxygenase-like lactoylglutathione lyase family enzyme|nr:VOC family protein [Burkholderiales bacterium]MDG2203509.1 VOC family protein [Burkholderiales bacterium]